MRKKSHITRLLALVMVVLLTAGIFNGCSKKNQNTPGSTAATSTGTAQTSDPKLNKTDYYEISMYEENLDPKLEQFAAQNSFRKLLKDKFNFGYKLLAYPGDPKEKLALDLASGQYPELVRMYTSDMVKKYATAGAVLDLTPLVDKYGPDFKARHQQNFKGWIGLSGLTDGKMYAYVYDDPDMSFGVSSPFLEWLIRSDILDQQGYPNIANEDDLMNVLKKGLAANPTTNGKPTIGMALPCAFSGGAGSSIIGHIVNLGNMHHFTLQWDMIYDPATKQYVDKTKNYSWIAGYHFFNNAYRQGILDKEAPTDDYDPFSKKMTDGRPLSTFFFTWGASGWNSALKTAGAKYRYVPYTFMLKTQAEHGEMKRYNVGSGNSDWQSMCITKNCKHPERLMEVLNYLATEEGYVRMGWGEEGVQYTVNNGKRVATQDYLTKSQNDPNYKYTYQSEWMLGFSPTLDKNGQIYNIDLDADVTAYNMDPIVKAAMAKYGWSNYQDMYLKNKNFKAQLNIPWTNMTDPNTYTTAQQKSWEKIVKLTQDDVIKLVIAKTDTDWNNAYNAMEKARSDQGVENLITIYNQKFNTWRQTVNEGY